jgi:hypothetical protein
MNLHEAPGFATQRGDGTKVPAPLANPGGRKDTAVPLASKICPERLSRATHCADD